MALADSALRMQVLEDMRDSPFPQHSLHLKSYLQGTRGTALSAAAARALNLSTPEFLDLLRPLPELAFRVDIHLDRAEWTGSSDIVVLGTLTSLRERRSLTSLPGYTVEGQQVDVPLTRKPRATLLTILPPQFAFGADPESARIAAPRRSRRTISTYPEEFKTTDVCVDCDPTCVECDSGGGSGGGSTTPPGVYIGTDCTISTIFQVTPETDRDADEMKDECEARLADALRPRFVHHAAEPHSGREPYWSVQQVQELNGLRWVTIMYLPAYYYDGGSFAHHGDSEFIMLKVTGELDYPDRWHVYTMTTSAHWGTCCDMDNTKTSNSTEIEWASNLRGRPYVYVSKDHHANYESESRCDRRIGDECSPISSGMLQDLAAFVDRNVGNSRYPFVLDTQLASLGLPNDCTQSKTDTTAHPGMECFLTTTVYTVYEGYLDDFSGWSRTHSDVTHYSKILKAYGMF